MGEAIERPEFVTDNMLDYLDGCRDIGMGIGDAQAGLRYHFGIGYDASSAVALYWIRTFTERHAPKKPTRRQLEADALARDEEAQREFADFNGLE